MCRKPNSLNESPNLPIVFGYTIPQYSRMKSTDVDAYRRFYCETCHQLKESYGLASTSMVNYDMTFNLIILSSVTDDCIDYPGTPNSLRCLFRKPAADSDLFRQMAGYTVLLTKWELYDDLVDKPDLRTNLIDLILTRAISKAESEYPEYDHIVGNGFEKLRDLEKGGCTDALLMGRTFGKALSKPMETMCDGIDTGKLSELFTSLTAAVYIMDAMDDLEDDFMDGTFNPFLSDRDGFVNRKTFMDSHMYELARLSRKSMEDLQNAYSEVKPMMHALTGVTDNIVYFGIPEAAKNALAGRGEAKLSVKNALEHRTERTATY